MFDSLLQDMKQPNGEEWKYADRRQELVFIGQALKHEAIQKILDQCLLNDEEMEMGPEKWAEAFADVDKIQLALDEGDDDEEGEEEEEEEDEGEDDGEDEEKAETASEGTEAVPTKKKKKTLY